MKLKPGRLPLTQQLLQAGQQLCLSIILVTSIPTAAVQAQITPDGSLPTNVQKLQEIMRINGGERAGNNLFHSLDEFNVPEGMEAVFENGLDIENIFTRITGDSISNINGILSTQGTANLFLVNPNGIVFGENAALNVGGSFIATTADEVQFSDETKFSARNADSKPILTIEFPIGLGFSSNVRNGAIKVNGSGNQITSASPASPTSLENNSQELEVGSGNTLGLIGKGINIDGGTLRAGDGNIELGSINSGVIGIKAIEDGFTFDYENVDNYRNIDVSNQAALDASGEKAGAISLIGNDITFKNSSVVLITNLGSSASGNININAAETFSLSGTSDDGNYSSAIRSETFSSGTGANVNVSTRNLVLENAGVVSTIAFADGSGGNIKIDAENSIELLDNVGIDPNRQTNPVGGIGSTTFASGNAGNVTVSAEILRAIGGSNLGSPTVGAGDGGDVSVEADFIELVGTNEIESFYSSIYASSGSTGKAGDVLVNASELRIIDGANINSSAIAVGNAGDVTINASESIEIVGQSQSSTEPQSSAIRSAVQIPSKPLQQFLGLDSDPTGNAGNVVVNTSSLVISRNGEVSVASEGTGDSGNLKIDAENINLDNNAGITAASASGTGGNVELNASNLEIEDGSSITATAENEGEGGNIAINTTNLIAKKNSDVTTNAVDGDGGNITINSETILGILNSDITANAIGGDGGNIVINSDFIVGVESRSRLTPFNDITATSEFGIDGTVTINTPDNNLDEQVYAGFKTYSVTQNRELLKQRCLNLRNPKGKIVDVGRAGIPANPDNFFDDEEVIAIEGIEENEAKTDTEAPVWVEGDPIEEPNAVKVGADGETYLVTQTEVSDASIEGVESQICTKAIAPHRTDEARN